MTVPIQYRMQTRRLALRPMTVEDAPRVYEIQSNWNVARMLRMASFPPVLEAIRDWLLLHDREWASGVAYRFAVVFEGQVAGCTDLDEISASSGELGYWLDEAFWGSGIATEAAEAVVKFAFGTAGLNRLLSGHAADNAASARVLTKLGFRPIGEERLWSRSRQQEIVQRKYELDATRSRR